MKASALSLGLWLGSIGLSGTSVMACGQNSTERVSHTGTVQFALSGTSSAGIKYRLRQGTFTITGTSDTTASTETDPESESIRLDLTAGNYEVALSPGWLLERATADGTFISVEAVLITANPQLFAIEEQQTTSVRFRFRVDQDVFELGDGALALGIEVQDDAASPRTLVLDDIDSGALANWTRSEITTNPILTCEEVISPYDGSTAILKTAVGTTYQDCSHAYLGRRFPLGFVASTDRASVWMYVGLSSDRSTYNLPGVHAVVYRNGTALGIIWYYRTDTTGDFYLNRALNTEPQRFRELGPDGYQALPLDKLAQLDPPYAVVPGPVEFDEIAVVFANYLCVGSNSVTFDAISLEY